MHAVHCSAAVAADNILFAGERLDSAERTQSAEALAAVVAVVEVQVARVELPAQVRQSV